ncbi:MAG: hypothetical protein V4621_03985 [Pseudomonadota bacterium]
MADTPVTTDQLMEDLARQCNALTPDVSFVFLPHTHHTLNDAITLIDSRIGPHPAAAIAKTILHKGQHSVSTRFHGIALHIQPRFFGLHLQAQALALVSVNTQEQANLPATTRSLLHQVWHALDTAIQIEHPQQLSRLRSGPVVPKRSPLSLSRANLKADVFAALLSEAYGFEGGITHQGSERALSTLTPRAHYRPWLYPFPLALEITHYAWNTLYASARGQYLNAVGTAYHLADEIGNQIEDHQIQRWWHFVEPAQDMAWRRETPSRILGLAMQRSPDPLLKTTALLISDVANITPDTLPLETQREYNAFATEASNRAAHEQVVEETFELVMAHSMQEHSSRPLYRAANDQNIKLSEGRIFGWCAAALQAAARAFDTAQVTGQSPVQMARMEFQGSHGMVNYEDLHSLSSEVISARRTGRAVTLSDLGKLTDGNIIFAPLMKSVQATLQHPDYKQQLAAVMTPAPIVPAARPTGPTIAPALAPTMAPQAAPAVGPRGPGMSGPGGMGGGGTAPIRYIQATAPLPVIKDDDT